MAALVLGIFLTLAACSSKTTSHKASATSDSSKIDTAAAKDLDTASQILGSGMVHP